MPIPKYTSRERKLVEQTLFERYGETPPMQAEEAELRLDLLKDDMTLCPALLWKTSDGAHFAIFKTGDGRFRCQFYYGDADQYGTGQDEYTSLGDCIISLLQVQAEHEENRRRIRSGINAVDFDKANDGNDYHGPLMV